MSKQGHSSGLAFSLIIASIALAQPASAESLKLAYGSPWVGWGPFFVAAEKGFFADEGLEVEIDYVKWDGPQGGFDALAGKDIDGRFTTLDEATLYWKPESPYAVMLATDISAGGDGVVVRNDRNISSIKDLKGKRIGLWRSTPSEFLLRYLLQQNDMSEHDVTLVDLSAEAAAAAVVAGDVDAAVTWSPYLGQSAADSHVDVLSTSKETPGLIADVLVMRKEALGAHPETCQGLVRAWNKAVAYVKANPDEAAAIMAKGLDYGTADNVKADLAGVTLQGKAESAQLFGAGVPGSARATANFAIEQWTRAGRLTTPVEAADLIDDRCLEK